MAPAIPFKSAFGSLRRPGRGAPAQPIQRSPAKADSKNSQSQGQSESQAQQEKQPYRSGYKINPALEDLDLDSNSNSNSPTALSSHSSTNKNHNENSGDGFDVKAFALQNHFNRIFPSLDNLDEPESVEWTQACTDESDTPATGESKSLTREKVVDEFLSVSYGELKEGETEEDRDLSQYDEEDQFPQAQIQVITQDGQTMQQIQKRGLGEFAGDDERDPGYDDHDKDDGMSKHEIKFQGLEESSEKQHQKNESQQQEDEGNAQEEDDRADLLEQSITRSGLGSKLIQLDSALDEENDYETGSLMNGSYSDYDSISPSYSAFGSEENQQGEDEQDHAEVLEGKVINTINRNKGLDVLRFDLEAVDEVPEWAKDCTSDIAVPPSVLNKEKKVTVVDSGKPGRRKAFTASSVFKDFMNGDTEIEKRLERGAPVESNQLQRRSAIPNGAPKGGRRRYRNIRGPIQMRSGLRSEPIRFSANQQWRPVSQAMPSKLHRRFVPSTEDDDEEFDDELFPINPDYKAYALREPYHRHCGVREKPMRIATDRTWRPVDQVMHHFHEKAAKSNRKAPSTEETAENNAEDASSEGHNLQKRSVETDDIVDEEAWQKVNQQDDTKDLIQNFWDEEDRDAGGDWGNVVNFMGDRILKSDKRQARKAEKAAARAERARMESFATEAAKAEIAYAKYPHLRDSQYADDYYYQEEEPEYEHPFDYSRGTYKGQGLNGVQNNGTQAGAQDARKIQVTGPRANGAQASQVFEHSAKNEPDLNGEEPLEDTKKADYSVSQSYEQDSANASADVLSDGEEATRQYPDGAILTGYEDDYGEWIEIVYTPNTPGKLEIDGWPYMTGYEDIERGWIAAPFTREIAESPEKFTRGSVLIEDIERPWTVGFHAPDGKWWEALCMPARVPMQKGNINVVEDQEIEIVEETVTIEEPRPTSKKEVGWFVESADISDEEEGTHSYSHERQWLDEPKEAEDTEEEEPITKVDGSVQVKVDETSDGELQSHQSVVEAVSTTGGNGRNSEGNYRYDRLTEYKAPRRPSRTTPRIQRRDLAPNPAASSESTNNDLEAVATWNLHKKVIAEKNGDLHTIADSGNPSVSMPTGTSTLSNSHHFSSNADGIALKVPKFRLGDKRNRRAKKERGGFIERMLEQEGELNPVVKGHEDVIPEIESVVTFEETVPAAPVVTQEPLPVLGASGPVVQRKVGRPAPIDNKALPFQQLKNIPARRPQQKPQQNRPPQTQARGKAHGKAPHQAAPAPAQGEAPTAEKPTTGKPTTGKPTAGKFTAGKPTAGRLTPGKFTPGKSTAGKPTPIKQVISHPSMVQEIQFDSTISPLPASKGSQIQRAQVPNRAEKVANNINAEGVTFNPLVDTNVNLKLKLGANEKGHGRKYHYKNGDVMTGDRVIDSPRGGSRAHGRKEEQQFVEFPVDTTASSEGCSSETQAPATSTTSSESSSTETQATATTTTSSESSSTETQATATTTTSFESSSTETQAPASTTTSFESSSTETQAPVTTTTSVSTSETQAPVTTTTSASASETQVVVASAALSVGSGSETQAPVTITATVSSSEVVPTATAESVTVTYEISPAEASIIFGTVGEIDTVVIDTIPTQEIDTVEFVDTVPDEEVDTVEVDVDTVTEVEVDLVYTDTATDEEGGVVDSDTTTDDDSEVDVIDSDTSTDEEVEVVDSDTSTDEEVEVVDIDTATDSDEEVAIVQETPPEVSAGVETCSLIPKIYETVSSIGEESIENLQAATQEIDRLMEIYRAGILAQCSVKLPLVSEIIKLEIESIAKDIVSQLELLVEEANQGVYTAITELQCGTEQATLAVQYEGYKLALGVRDLEQQATERYDALASKEPISEYINLQDSAYKRQTALVALTDAVEQLQTTTLELLEVIIDELPSQFYPIIEQLERDGATLFESGSCQPIKCAYGDDESVEGRLQAHHSIAGFEGSIREDFNAEAFGGALKEGHYEREDEEYTFDAQNTDIEAVTQSSSYETSYEAESYPEESFAPFVPVESSQTESVTPVVEPSHAEYSAPIEEPSQVKYSAPIEEPSQVEYSAPIVEPYQVEYSAPIEEPSQVEYSAPIEKPSQVEYSAPIEKPSQVEYSAPIEEPSQTKSSVPLTEVSQDEKIASSTVPTQGQWAKPSQGFAQWSESDFSEDDSNPEWIGNSQGDNRPSWQWQFHDSSSSSEDSDSQTTGPDSLENPFHVKTYRTNYRPAHHNIIESTVIEEKAPQETSTIINTVVAPTNKDIGAVEVQSVVTVGESHTGVPHSSHGDSTSASSDSHSRSESASFGHAKRDVFYGSREAKDFHREPLPDVVGELSLFLQDRRSKNKLHKRRLPNIDPHNAEDWQKLDRVTMKKPEDVSSSLRSSLSKAVSKTHTKDSTKDSEPVDLVAEEIVEVEEVDEVPYRPVIKNEQVPGGFWDKYLGKSHKLGGHYTTDESQHIPSVSSHTSSSTSDANKFNEKIAEAKERPQIHYLAKRDFKEMEEDTVGIDTDRLQRAMAMLNTVEVVAFEQQEVTSGLGFSPVVPMQNCSTEHPMFCLGMMLGAGCTLLTLWMFYLKNKKLKERARRAVMLSYGTEKA